MSIFSLNFLFELFAGKPLPVKVNLTRSDDLNEASATRGTLVIGDPGQGKTEYVANQIFESWKAYHEKAVFVFDWSGGLTNALLKRISRDDHYEELFKRIVLDELGNEEFITPKPEFDQGYGLSREEQVSRVVGNMERLAQFMAKGAPFLTTVSINEIGHELFRLLTAITNEHGECWQLTEAKKLLIDLPLLRKACAMFGMREPDAKWFFEHEYMDKDFLKASEKELSSKVLRVLLTKISNRETRATVGYYKPGWTPKEATEKGLMVLIDAHKMINTPEAQHYLLMQNFSLIMNWINKREVDDPTYHPAMIAFDETYTILKIPGMAEWLGMVSPLYRSRKVQLLIIIQDLWQLTEELREQIWTLGNIVSFAVSNSDNAEIIAKQLFDYDPRSIKNPPKTPQQNPTTEPVLGQDRIGGDFIQNLKPRQFIMRRYLTEQQKEKGVLFVEKTADTPQNPLHIELSEVKRMLIRERGVSVREALEEINKRKLPSAQDDSLTRTL